MLRLPASAPAVVLVALTVASSARAVPVRVVGRTELAIRATPGPKGLVVSGQLQDDEDEPIADADLEVRVGQLPPRLGRTDGVGAFEVVITDGDLSLAGAGALPVQVRYGGHVLWSPAAKELTVAPDAQPVALHLTLVPSSFAWAERDSVSPKALVTARTPTGPLADAQLSLALGGQRLSAQTDANGRAVFRGLVLPNAGVHEVVVSHEPTFRYEGAVTSRPLVAVRSAALEGEAKVNAAGALEVRAAVHLDPPGEPQGTLQVRLNGRSVAELTPSGGEALTALIALPEFGALHGVSAVDAELEYVPAVGEAAAALPLGRHAVIEPPTSALDWLPLPLAGAVAVWFWWRRPRAAPPATARRPARSGTAPPVPARRPPVDGLGGQVVDGLTGRPLAGVALRLVGPDGATQAETLSDDDGAFVFFGAEADGAVELRFERPAYLAHSVPVGARARGLLPTVALVPLRAEALRAYERVLARFGLGRRFGLATSRDLVAPLTRAAGREVLPATLAFERAYFGPPESATEARGEARRALDALSERTP